MFICRAAEKISRPRDKKQIKATNMNGILKKGNPPPGARLLWPRILFWTGLSPLSGTIYVSKITILRQLISKFVENA